jgi:hypothetical protein
LVVSGTDGRNEGASELIRRAMSRPRRDDPVSRFASRGGNYGRRFVATHQDLLGAAAIETTSVRTASLESSPTTPSPDPAPSTSNHDQHQVDRLPQPATSQSRDSAGRNNGTVSELSTALSEPFSPAVAPEAGRQSPDANSLNWNRATLLRTPAEKRRSRFARDKTTAKFTWLGQRAISLAHEAKSGFMSIASRTGAGLSRIGKDMKGEWDRLKALEKEERHRDLVERRFTPRRRRPTIGVSYAAWRTGRALMTRPGSAISRLFGRSRLAEDEAKSGGHGGDLSYTSYEGT